MFRLLMLLTIVACMSAIPAAAQAPTPPTTAYDGTYVGVSREASTYTSGQKRCLSNTSDPRPR
jgi:hypothetical protein